MTLTDLTQMFSTDEQCRALLKKLRWPLGIECLRCKSKRVFEVATQKKFECVECGYQFSVLTQTIFHDTHLPLETIHGDHLSELQEKLRQQPGVEQTVTFRRCSARERNER